MAIDRSLLQKINYRKSLCVEVSVFKLTQDSPHTKCSLQRFLSENSAREMIAPTRDEFCTIRRKNNFEDGNHQNAVHGRFGFVTPANFLSFTQLVCDRLVINY